MLNFQAVLTNVKFDIDCRNVLYFDNREAQENYFSVASLFSSAQPINFNAGSLIETTIIYQVQENESINDILSKNYCIIKDNNENATLKYYYYFVKNAMQDSGNQVKVWLELDIFQTYFIDMEFSDCEILKAHLNRFVDNGDGTVSFDGNPESKLFEGEALATFPKKLVERKTFALTTDRTPSEIVSETIELMDNNFISWIYVYLNKSILNAEFSGLGFPTKARVMREEVDEQYLTMPYVVLAFPMVKQGGFAVNMQRRFETTYLWDFSSFMASVLPQIASHILDIRLSQTAPFPNMNFFDSYLIKSDLDTKIITIEDMKSEEHTNNTYAEFFPLGRVQGGSSGYMACIIYTHVVDTELYYSLKDGMNSRTISSGIEYSFQKNEIVGSLKNKKFNPKLLSEKFTEIRLGQGLAEPFIYDAQKMNTNDILMLWRESIVPGITRSFIALIDNDTDNDNNFYNKKTFESMLGTSLSQDSSFPYSENQLSTYLANNKNFFLQNSINRAANLVGGLFGAGAQLRGAETMKNSVPSTMGAYTGLVNTGLDYLTSKVNENLTVDNMKNAPESYQKLNGNPALSLSVNDNRTYVEVWQALENELEIANDYMCQFGFTVNTIGNLKDFVNIRKYYNYIEADIQETGGIPISKTVHERFKEMFARGVRFWNNDSFSYELENYERWLEA